MFSHIFPTFSIRQVIKSIQNVIQTNVSVSTSLGQPFLTQFNVIFPDMLQVGGGRQGRVAQSSCDAIFSLLWVESG